MGERWVSSDLLDWASVRKQLAGHKSTLLAGNGLSIDFHDGFKYTHLLDEADGGKLGPLKALFGGLGTTNFETVLRFAWGTRLTLEALEEAVPDQVRVLRERLQKAFVEALKKVHPVTPAEQEFKTCQDNARRFLSCFEALFTTNYDLLLYWTDCANEKQPQFSDGFGKCDGKLLFKDKFVGKSMWYLHGALHLVPETLFVLRKLKSGRELRLIELIQKFNGGCAPLVVLEGNSEHKLKAIEQNSYLKKAHHALSKTKGHLVTFGFSFDDADMHIKDAIQKSKITDVWVGRLPDDNERPTIAGKTMHYYDAHSVDVWGLNSSKTKP